MPSDLTPTLYATVSATSQSSATDSAPLFLFPVLGFLVFFVFAIGILAFVLWIWGIVHAAKNPYIKDSTVRAVWLILMVLIGFPVTVIYFFVHPKKPAVGGQPTQTPGTK